MKTKFTVIRRMLMLSICIAFLATCKKNMNVVSSDQNKLLSKATTFTSNEKLPVDVIVFVPCANGGAGENVHLTGTIHILIHTTVNKNNFTAKYQLQPQGLSGTGETTGDKYRGSGASQEKAEGSFNNDKSIDTFLNNFKIVGHGTNYRMHVNTHITVNA